MNQKECLAYQRRTLSLKTACSQGTQSCLRVIRALRDIAEALDFIENYALEAILLTFCYEQSSLPPSILPGPMILGLISSIKVSAPLGRIVQVS